MKARDNGPVTAAALYIARRAGIVRRPRPPRVRVPRLRVALDSTAAPPTVWMVCPHSDKPAGGIRKQYRAVDVLNQAGVPAAVVHERDGFACSWFDHTTRIVSASDIAIGERDVIAVPEIYWATMQDLPSGIRQVIFNQNAYLTLDSLATGQARAAAPYVANHDLAAVVVVSEDNAELLRYVFPGAPIKRIHHGLDSAVHHPATELPGRRIAYMPRRRAGEASQVLDLLKLRGALDGWEVVAIEGSTEAGVAGQLRSSRIFLSFSEREGFGLPPCEALACGCLVVGFDGFAGREFFRSPFAHSVENGDVVAFARAVEDLMRRTEDDPAAAKVAAHAGSRFVHERYSPVVERRDLVEVFAPLLSS